MEAGFSVTVGSTCKLGASKSQICGRPVGRVAVAQRSIMEERRSLSHPGQKATVQMNLLSRFFRVFRANANQAVTSMEDPEKIMKQTLDEMERDLSRVQKSYAETAASQKRTESQQVQVQKAVEEWSKRAEMALKKGDEELAREALNVKKQKEAESVKLEEQVAGLRDAAEKLYSSLQMYQNKVEQSKAEAVSYTSRAVAAKTVQAVNEMTTGVGESSAATFEKMKEKVEAMEIGAEVTAESLPQGADPNLQAKFRALESDDVEDELEKMKRRLASGGD